MLDYGRFYTILLYCGLRYRRHRHPYVLTHIYDLLYTGLTQGD